LYNLAPEIELTLSTRLIYSNFLDKPTRKPLLWRQGFQKSVMSPKDLLQSAQTILAEVEQFAAYALKQNADLESRHFANDLRHEINRLDLVSSSRFIAKLSFCFPGIPAIRHVHNPCFISYLDS
jgi:hypothetical protein